jgi:uncharacterized protein (TIGR02246 family)
MKKISILIALFTMFSICVFGQVNDKYRKQTEKARPAIETVFKRFVETYNKQEADALAALYAENATYIGTAGDITQGREKIRVGLKNSLQYLRDMQITPAEFGANGDLAYQSGAYSQKVVVPNQPPETYSGKYLIVLRRMPDKTWKIQTQMVSRDRAQR